jgi:serine/threonine protein kinase
MQQFLSRFAFKGFAQMGCVCAKQADVLDDPDSPKVKGSNLPSSRWSASSDTKQLPHHPDSAILHHYHQPRDESNEAKLKESSHGGSKRRTRQGRDSDDEDLGILVRNPSNHSEAELVAAGWPAWMAAFAGEAIHGWIPRRAESFEKLYKIGQGTYSNVYKARDLDNGKIVALKKVRFDNLEPESVRFMAREILVLRKLDHPNVVKLEGLVTSEVSCSLYLVFEYMEHDLSGLAACPGIKFTEPQVKCYMQQLLRGLDHCHSHGVLHRDIKGSNLLIDNGGILKIADFGLATFFYPDQKQLLTSRVVTLWYRPPELLLGATDYGVAVDLWSAGCILAELLAGKPILPGRTEVEQLHKIFKLCGSPSEDYWKESKLPHATIFKPQHPYKSCIAEAFKDFSPSALALLETLLAIEPGHRGEAIGALKSEFFTTEPLACDPSSLPKYPPSKEFDAKLRAQEARRKRDAGVRGHGSEAQRRASRLSRAGPTPNEGAELATLTQKQHLTSRAASNIRSEKSSTQQEDYTAGLHIGPLRPVHHSHEITGVSRAYDGIRGVDYSGPISYTHVSGSTSGKKPKKDHLEGLPDRSSLQPSKALIVSDSKSEKMYGQNHVADLSNLSRPAVGRNCDATGMHQSLSSLLQQIQDDTLDGIDIGTHEYARLPVSFAKQKSAQLQRPTAFKYVDGVQLKDTHGVNRKSDERLASKEPVMGSYHHGQRIHCSGPLLHPSANIEEILQKHEQQIQQAVRRQHHGKREALSNKSSLPGKKPVDHKGWVSTGKGNKELPYFKGKGNKELLDFKGGPTAKVTNFRKKVK